MPDLNRVNYEKEKILATIQTKGPSFPARISRETGMQPLFVGAYLAELASERKVKISNMKVGSSPIYFLEHQAQELEKFTEYLNQKEREALLALKKTGVLEDETQHPVTRVALRKIPDFAQPITVRINSEAKLFWKYFTLTDEETKEKIEILVNGQTKPKEKTPEKELPKQSEVQRTHPIQSEEKLNEQSPEKPIEKKQEKQERIFHPVLENVQKKKKEVPDHEFPKTVRTFLTKKGLTITKEILAKKKEFVATATHLSLFGEQTYLVIAKEKKKITQDDILVAARNAQTERMPALLLANGKPDKKALHYVQEWGNVVKTDVLE